MAERQMPKEVCNRCGRVRYYGCKSMADMEGVAFDGDGQCRDMLIRYGGTMSNVRAVGVARAQPARRPE